MEILTKSPRETQEFGQKLGGSLKGGEVLALSGDLGSGKTTFTQGLAESLGVKERIISPTFILRRDYKSSARELELNHVDLYRLEDNLIEEFRNLGLEELFGDKSHILVIEWAEKVKNAIPKGAIWIKFQALDGERKITI